ncbi:MAG: glycosyltransferase family 39 protein [Ruminococcus sp.]|nr:glycosyltransferase family 39 protein [Ruminococcus sp.]
MNKKSNNKSNSTVKSQNKKKSANHSSTITNRKRQNTLEYVIVNLICLLVFVAFGYIAIMSMIQTSVIDPTNYGNEVILYQNDTIPFNILITALFGIFIFKMKKHYDFFAKVNMKYLEIALVAYTFVLGLIWVMSVSSIPAADSQNIFETATNATKGIYTSFIDGANFYNKDFYAGNSYFKFYPFQLGFVFICEMIYRIFGTATAQPLEVINAICVAVAYLGLAKISRLLFKKLSIEFFTILLLAGCFQPMLFSTFAYGNIMGMCFAVWSVYFLIKYFQTSKYKLLIPCGILLVIATLAKYNNMIYLVAFVIVLIIHTVSNKKWQSLVFALILCIATTGASNLIIMSYESRANVKLPSGVSQVLYLNIGLSDSYMAPGWYSKSGVDTYINSSFDTEKANAMAWQDINTKLNRMSGDSAYTIDFFGKKILSQWNEPTFESIWVSKVKGHYYSLNGIGTSMYNASLGQFFELFFNYYIQILYIAFSVGVYCMFLNKKSNTQTVILPLVILGGFGYHLLFEGKSQYILTYIPLLTPFAAYGISCILNGKYTSIIKLVQKLKYIPDTEKVSEAEEK